jgi:hypothetical protein
MIRVGLNVKSTLSEKAQSLHVCCTTELDKQTLFLQGKVNICLCIIPRNPYDTVEGNNCRMCSHYALPTIKDLNSQWTEN